MNSSPAVLPVPYGEICDELGCELSRDSMDGRQRDHVRATGRPISRFRTISGPCVPRYAATPRRFNGATLTGLARDRTL